MSLFPRGHLWQRVKDKWRAGMLYHLAMILWSVVTSSLLYAFCTGGAQSHRHWMESKSYGILSSICALPFRFVKWGYDRLTKGDTTGTVLPAMARGSARYLPTLCGVYSVALLVIDQPLWSNYYSLVGGILLVAVSLLAYVKQQEFMLSISKLGLFPMLYGGSVVVALICSRYMELSLRFFAFHLSCGLIVWAMVTACARGIHVQRIIQVLSVGFFIAALYGAVQGVVGVEVDELLTDVVTSGTTPGRVYSFFENPNSFAAVLLLFAPIMLGLAIFLPRGSRGRKWYGFTFLLAMFALLMTYSRGGWLSICVSLGIMALALVPKFVPLLIPLGLLALPFLPTTILSRILSIFSGADSSIYTRGYIYTAMGRLIGSTPIFGVGLGSGAVALAIAVGEFYEAEATFVHGHNVFLQIWAEMGIVGILCFVLSMVMVIRGGIQQRKHPNPYVRAVSLGGGAGLCGALTMGLTEYIWHYPRVMVLFWLAFALVAGCHRIPATPEETVH